MGALRDILAPVGALLLFAGVALTLTAAGSVLEYHNAVELRGVVSAKDLVRAEREKNRSTRFGVRYRVVLPSGETLEVEENLPRVIWETRTVGEPHPVLYLSAKRMALPSLGSSEFVGATIMGVIGPILVIVGCLVLRRPVRKLLERIRLLRRGVASTATVVDVFQTSTSINDVILWQLRYRYRDPGGKEHEAASGLLMPDEADAWQVGTSGAILYDPLRPQISAWLGRHALVPDPAKPWLALGRRIWSKVNSLMGWVIHLALFFTALLLAAVIGELVVPLKELEVWMTDQRIALLLATAGTGVLGVFLLIGSVISLLMDGGQPMDHTDIENHQRWMRDATPAPRVGRISTYRLIGTGSGVSGADEFSLSQLKRALASGAILSDSTWRRRGCAAFGAALLFLGIFGSLIVIAPLALKLILATVVLYVLVRIVWAYARA